jgi:cobalt-precorrin 5A hydrolase
VTEAAARLGLSLVMIGADALAAAQPRCPTRSEAAARAVGVGSVAEGCALAASGAGGRLLLPRVAHGGATCALAEPA